MSTPTDAVICQFVLGRPGADWIASELRARGVPAQYKRVTRDDHDADYDDWPPGEYVFTTYDHAERWRAAKLTAPTTTVAEHFGYCFERTAAS